MNISADAARHGSSGSGGQAIDPGAAALLTRSALYQEYLAEHEEILRHKWIESEKAGGDIGFNTALTSWVVRHRSKWRQARRNSISASS